MLPFKLFFEQQALGLIETIHIDGIGSVAAKVDSGNGAYNVITGTDVHVGGPKSGIKVVSFITVDNKRVTKLFKGFIDINIGSGNIEQRPTVLFDVKIKGKDYHDVRFSIADRSQNEEKVLLGKDFIEKLGGIIDVTK